MGCADCPNGPLHERVGLLEQGQARQTAVLEGINENLGRLVSIGERQIRLEERQIEDRRAIERAFDAIGDEADARAGADEKLGERVKSLEGDAPKNRIATGWMFSVVQWVVAAIVGGALVKLLA